MEDRQIVKLFFERNERALYETDAKYRRYLLSIAGNLLKTRESAEECVNDTYEAAWNAIPPANPTVLQAFLGKITRNLALKALRSENAKKRGGGERTASIEELEECIASPFSVEKEIETRMLSEKLTDFLLTLSPDERRVFLCRYWYFDSIAAISERFSFSESKVKMMLKRTRDKLQHYLQEEGFL